MRTASAAQAVAKAKRRGKAAEPTANGPIPRPPGGGDCKPAFGMTLTLC